MQIGIAMSLTMAAGSAEVEERQVLAEADRVAAGYTLSEDERTVVNTSGGADYRRFVTFDKPLQADNSAIWYWEVAYQRTAVGAANGYLGVVDGPARDAWQTENNPIDFTSVGYRANGDIWSGAASQVTGLPTYGDGDVIMLAFQPFTGNFWVGKNGVWANDPSGAPTYQTTPGTFWPQIQGRDQGDGGTLRSVASQFSYPVPAGAIPLADDPPGWPLGYPELSSMKSGVVLRDDVVYTDAAKLSSVKVGVVLREV